MTHETSNRSRDRKISSFLEQTAIPSDAKLTYISGNTNFQISLADFLASIGVTGTIVQKGDVLGTPILNKAGSVNEIRNLEAGPGIKTSVSPEGGATIEHGFQQGASGVPVLVNPTAQLPFIANLLAGIGITISAPSPGVVQIAAPGIVTASNVVIVNQMSDFPTAVSGVRTLAANTDYLVSADLSTSDRFVFGDGSVVSAADRFVGSITYTGSGTMFTGSEVSGSIKDTTLTASSGQVFDFSSTGTDDVFIFEDVTVSGANKVGALSGMSGVRFRGIVLTGTISDGVTFTGNNPIFFSDGMNGQLAAGDLYDLGAATFGTFSAISNFITLAAGSVFLKGAAASANINAGGLGSVTGCRFSGAGAPLNTISVEDAFWQFAENDDIADTRPDGLLSLQGNLTNTVITVIGTPVLVAGTWVVEQSSQMTGTTGGRLTYDGGKDARLPISFSVSVEPVSGGAQIISACVAIDGAVIANSVRTASASPGSPASITIPWQETFSTGTFVEVFVANETTTNDVLASSAIARIN